MAFARWERPIVDEAGNIISNATIRVRRRVPGFPMAQPIYQDYDGTTVQDNPFTLLPSDNGVAGFHAVGGWYRIEITAPGGFSQTLDWVPIGTTQATDTDAYQAVGFTWAPESATAAPPSTGSIRANNANVVSATHLFISRQTLGNSDATKWLADLRQNDWIMLSTGVGVEFGWRVLAATQNTGYYDVQIDPTTYAGPAGPIALADSGFVSVSQQKKGDTGALNGTLYFAASDETLPLSVGTAKVTLRSVAAIIVTSVRASLKVASTSGLVTIDVKVNGVSMFSTLLTIDANEKTSVTAATPAVISHPNIPDDAEITVDVTGAGTGATGLKIALMV